MRPLPSFVLVILALLASGSSAVAQRLPRIAVPTHYQIALDPQLAPATFTGEETIDVRILKPTREIVLNSLDLDIASAQATANGTMQAAQVIYDKPDEFIRLVFPQELPAAAAALHLTFSGKLTTGLRGLYLSRSKRRAYAVTQFEGTYARMMFPGFDEPAYKATFDLSVAADNGDTAISNGRILRDEPILNTDRHKVTFSTSPRMSTYLVALAIGDWQCNGRTVDGVPIRVCAIPEDKDKTQFGLDVAAHAIAFYDQWYGIQYPFGKLDMLAIPDYEWGGMENTAAIFYRDTALLFDEKTGSVSRRRAQAVTIAHEIAHQWFGDLVTAASWDDIWLNEGFATWMSFKPIEAWHPEWKLENDAAGNAQAVMNADSYAATRAIHGNPTTPAEIKEMFDGVTYEKGAAVLRMLESYLGPETFRKGVNAYLATYANGNATSADFWQTLAHVSGKPVDKIMPTFVLQPGVPMLAVSGFPGGCAGNQTRISLAQQRFFISPAELAKPSSEQWQIPVCIKAPDVPGSTCALVTDRRQEITINQCEPWAFLNVNADGYYRVAYTPGSLMLIAAEAEAKLNTPERIALLSDTWATTRAGKTSIADYLALVEQLRPERERAVLDPLAGQLDFIRTTLVPAESAAKFQTFARDQFGPLAQELGWTARPGDTDEQKGLRASLLSILGSANDPGAIAAARSLVQQYLKDPASVEGTEAAEAFAVAAAHGDAVLYEQLLTALGKAKSPNQREQYLFALTAFPQPELQKRTLALVDQGKILGQEYPAFFSALLRNPAARAPAWSYLKAHWDELAQKVSSFGGRGAVSALGGFCSAPERDDVQVFFREHRAPGAERALKHSLEQMDNCIEFKQLQQKDMSSWLAR